MTESHLVVVARITAREGRTEEVAEALRDLIEPSRAEAGCLRYDLHQSQEDPHRFVFLEAWTDEAALAAHFQTDHFLKAGPRLEPLLASPPEIGQFRQIA